MTKKSPYGLPPAPKGVSQPRTVKPPVAHPGALPKTSGPKGGFGYKPLPSKASGKSPFSFKPVQMRSSRPRGK